MYFDIRLWRLTRGTRAAMLGGMLLGLLALAAGIARFAFLGVALARVFAGAVPRDVAWPMAAAVAAVLLRGALEHARTFQAHRTAAVVQTRLRAALFDRIAALGPAWFAGERTGSVMLAMVDGVEQLQSFFGQYLPQLAIAACAPLAIFAFIAFWDVPVALVLLLAALFTLVLPSTVHGWDRRASIARSRAFKAFGAEFLDAVQGLPTLQAFGQSRAYGQKLAAKARALYQSTFWVLALSVLTLFSPFYLSVIDRLLGDWNHEWTPAQLFELALLVTALKFMATWLLMLWRPLRLALTPSWVKHHRVRARAMAAFRLAADNRTSGSTAVLIYLSRAERRAEIIAEAGIARKVAPDVWGAAMLALLGPVKAGRVADGLVDCMAAVGTVLAHHFPRDAHDANELPDRLIEL